MKNGMDNGNGDKAGTFLGAKGMDSRTSGLGMILLNSIFFPPPPVRLPYSGSINIAYMAGLVCVTLYVNYAARNNNNQK